MPSRGSPLSNSACGARGLSSQVTDDGPPEKMMPLGAQPFEGFLGGVERGDLAIDARFADAAGDELGHLAAEVDDEQGFGRLHEAAGLRSRDTRKGAEALWLRRLPVHRGGRISG